MLAGYTSSGALHLNTTSTEDRDSKRALAAADAGRNLALFRLNKIKPADDQCLADAAVAPTGGECPSSSTIDLGNGATASYRVTPKLALSDSCRSVSGAALETSDAVRCITAIGTVNGVRRRVAWRVVAHPLFPVAGLVGTDYIHQENSSRVWADRAGTVLGDLGTNTHAERFHTSQQRNVILGPGATSQGFQPSQIVNRPAPFDVPMGDFEPVENTNDNANLSSLPATVWNATTREFTLGGSSTIVLTGGDYHVCRLSTAQSSKLFVTPGQRVRFFVDSPERDGGSSEPQTSCANTSGGVGVATGTVDIGQSSTFAACDAVSGSTCTALGNPANLQLFTYGRRSVTPYDISVANSGDRVMTIYAPRSRVHFGNSTQVIGTAVAAEVTINNSMQFFFDPRLFDVHDAQYKGRQWNECTAQNGSADPEAGC